MNFSYIRSFEILANVKQKKGALYASNNPLDGL